MPRQKDGCLYEMNDQPGFYNVRNGNNYELSLDFKGELQNTSEDKILVTRFWTVYGKVTVPAIEKETAMAGMQPGDEIIGVHIARDADSGAAEAHLVITRRASSPPLDPNALPIVLKDGDGKPLTAAAVAIGPFKRISVIPSCVHMQFCHGFPPNICAAAFRTSYNCMTY